MKPCNLPMSYDVFISYNRLDHEAAEFLGTELRRRGLKVFLDRWYLAPGQPWIGRLEEILGDCGAIAVLLGPHGMGPSQPVWDAVTLVPGERPLMSLTAALVARLEPDASRSDRLISAGNLREEIVEDRLTLLDVVRQALEAQPGTDRLLLFVDQWEELYTSCEDEAVRRCFVDQLLSVSDKGPVSVVLTVRGDSVGEAVSYRPLADRLQKADVKLGPLNREELRPRMADSGGIPLSFSVDP